MPDPNPGLAPNFAFLVAISNQRCAVPIACHSTAPVPVALACLLSHTQMLFGMGTSADTSLTGEIVILDMQEQSTFRRPPIGSVLLRDRTLDRSEQAREPTVVGASLRCSSLDPEDPALPWEVPALKAGSQ